MSYLAHPAYIQSKLLNTLRGALGGWMSVDELIDIVYQGCKEPENAYTSIRIAAHMLRHKGYPVLGHKSRGYRFSPTSPTTE